MRHVCRRIATPAPALIALLVVAVSAWSKENPVPSKASVFHVATNGKDSWSGALPRPNATQTDGPFATLGRARAAARAAGTSVPRRIVVHAGEYFLARPLVLGPEDSGLTLEAAKAGTATLYGGKRVTEWQRDGERFWSARLPGVSEGTWDFRMLVANGRFCRRARLPTKGHFTHLSQGPGPSRRLTTSGRFTLTGGNASPPRPS